MNMILVALKVLTDGLSMIVANMASLNLDTYVTLSSFILTIMVINIVIHIIGGLIRHNGNS